MASIPSTFKQELDMKSRTIAMSIITIGMLLQGCASVEPERNVSVQPLHDRHCNVTASSWAHIDARHCTAGQGTEFDAAYCSQAAMQTLCTAAQTAANAVSRRVVQADSNIRYDVNMAHAYGAGGETCVRLVIKPSGEVVTLFPEDAGAPGACI
jgi:predicted nucleic acid-binding protein